MEEILLFDIEEVEAKRNKVIKKSTSLIQKARHTLSAKELTLVDYMATNVTESDGKFYVVNTTIAEINEICKFGQGGAAHINTEKALLDLANKGFWIQMPDGTKTVGRWLDKPYIKEGRVKLKLDSDLAPYLLNLVDEQTTKLFFLDVVNLKSIYSKKLYELLQSYPPESEVFLSVVEVKELFQKEALEWYRVLPYLRKARDDINRQTSMEVKYTTVKQGRNTEGINLVHNLKKLKTIND